MKKLMILLYAVLFFVQAGVIYAEDFNKTTFNLGEVVVIADKEGRGVIDEGEYKSKIDDKTLRTHKIVDMAEILSDELIEGSMLRKSSYGNEVALRGFSQSDLRVLIDGGFIEGACGVRKDPSLSHINMLTVDKIEVQEGPFDVTKAGALGGSINVITKKPQEKFGGEIITKFGSYEYLSRGGYFTGGNKTIQALVGYNYSESGQYEDGDGNKLCSFAKPAQAYKASEKDRKAFTKHDVWAKLQITPIENQTILLSHQYGKARDILAPRHGFDTSEELTFLSRAECSIKEVGGFSDKLTFSLYNNRVEHYPSTKFRDISPEKNNEVISNIFGGKIKNEQTTDIAILTYGFDSYKRDWGGDVYNTDTGVKINDEFIPDVDTYNVGLYVKADKDFDKWSLGAGLRGDWFQTEADEACPKSMAGGFAKNKHTDILPTGYLSAEYYLTDNMIFFSGVGRSIRIPTAVERYIQGSNTFFGNPELESTKNTEFDLGFQSDFERVSFKVKAFYSDLEDYIYQHKNIANNKTWTNIDAHIYGGDIKVLGYLGNDFSLEGAMAYQLGRKDSQPDNNSDRDLAQIPPLKTKIALHYDNGSLLGILEWIHLQKAGDVDQAAGEQVLKGWDVLNFRAGYQYTQLAFNVGIDNITDRCYAVANSYEWDVVSGTGATPAVINEPGRFIYASFSYLF